MFGRHKHDFEKVAERFNQPVRPSKVNNIDEATLERMIFGFTVVTYQCKECPEVRFTRVTGRSADAKVGA